MRRPLRYSCFKQVGPPQAGPQEGWSGVAAGWSFSRFELRPAQRQLLEAGAPVALGARAMDLLLTLVRHADRVLSKAELLDAAWPGLVVEENNLSVQISALRKLLGAQAIATVPAVGYQFALELRPLGQRPLAPAVVGVAASPDAVQPPLRQALAGQPVRLCLRRHHDDAALAGDWARLLSRHGGQASLPPDARTWLAELPDARQAVALAHALHGRGLALGLHAEADGERAAATARALAERATPGQALASAAVVAQLVPPLDGDVIDQGPQHLPMLGTTLPTYELTPGYLPFGLGSGVAAATAPAGGPRRLRPTLAVLPFGSYSAEPEPVRFGDLLADQLIAALSTSGALNVISRLSTQGLRDRELPLPQIGRCLGADYLVSGRYWRTGQGERQVRVMVELADTADGHVLWSQTLADQELAVLHSDSELLQGLVGGLSQALYLHEVRQLRTQPLPSLASHTLLLAGVNLLYRLTPADFLLAHQALSLLHERAPRHAAPLAWLARWHLFRVVQGWSDDRDGDGRLALDFAQRALDLDPDSALALTMLAAIETGWRHDLVRADDLCQQALLLNPSESLAWLQKGNAASFRGDGRAALADTEHAVGLSPLDPARHVYLGLLAGAALTAGEHTRAIEAARQSLRLNAGHLSSHRVLAIALSLSGRLDEARQSVRQILRIDPTLTVARYVARSPGAQSGLARSFAQALQAAGLPAGDTSPP